MADCFRELPAVTCLDRVEDEQIGAPLSRRHSRDDASPPTSGPGWPAADGASGSIAILRRTGACKNRAATRRARPKRTRA